MDEVTMLRPGLVLEANKSVVLMFKDGLEANISIVLCVWASSPGHPFVVWDYEEITGALYNGNYYTNLEDALKKFRSAQ